MIRRLVHLALCLQVAWAQCDPSTCKLPSCQCMSTTPPGGLATKDTPQLIFLTFDDAITSSNYENYTAILGNRVNPNGCPISMTFYVNHKDNDYTYSHDLFYRGNEMASKSVTHKTPSDLWANMTTAEGVAEIGDMGKMLELYAKVPASSVKGYRAPFLQTSGDKTFQALSQLNMQYDHSFPSKVNNSKPIWPYTLDYGMQHDCQIGNCPSGRFPGFWMVPMNMLDGLDGTASCSMADACFNPENSSRTFDYLKQNFDRSYYGNKAPVGVYLHSAWFQGWIHHLDGYIRFLDYVQQFHDVYIVSVSKGLAWLKNPVPTSQAGGVLNCPAVSRPACIARSCTYIDDEGRDITMRSCTSCPDNYPWLGNVEGI